MNHGGKKPWVRRCEITYLRADDDCPSPEVHLDEITMLVKVGRIDGAAGPHTPRHWITEP
ncbi:hypothetical protein [Streptomyces sp. YGL11-2]|uniref:hypothetical protein n=1 Tax=Streptomyces sp. YGL11-2 TaxID=3414028 RepID=UPI003CEFF86A